MKNNIVDLRTKKISKALSDKTYEYCSIYWAKTMTRKDDPIEMRHFYVEGVGQLCPRCYQGLYG